MYETFSAEYFQRLAGGDSEAGEHFAAYFLRVLPLKVRPRLRNHLYTEDVCQETLLRVWAAVQRQGGVRRPESLGSFVNGVCDKVILEFDRKNSRFEGLEGQPMPEPADPSATADAVLSDHDAKREVQRIFASLGEKDRLILQAIFLDGIAKAEFCRMLDVDSTYLRVLLFRAKGEFRKAYTARQAKEQKPVKTQ